MNTAQAYERHATLAVLASEEHSLRMRLLVRPRDPDARELLEGSARVLELNLVLATIQEAIKRLGLNTLVEAIAAHERVDALAVTLSRLDVARVLRENASVFAQINFIPPGDAPVSVDSDLVVRAVQSLLLHCPIRYLEERAAGSDADLGSLGHRCRMAYDGLQAFVTRNVHPQREAIAAAGQAYAEGRLTVGEVGAVLGLSIPDAVAQLEAHGFRRSVESLRLTEEARAKRLEEIRTDRMARGGAPVHSPDLLARDVIASQRIEGIDARPWLPRE